MFNVNLFKLRDIISGLNTIHQKQLIHCDFHHGNILSQEYFMFISDLGLCKPVEYFQHSKKDDNIYGVLPFVAPEILRGKSYTTASDIYSFSMIMWEFTSGMPPFDDRAHDLQLSLNICNGERPAIIENTPQCYVNLMKKCWDKDSSKRPNASEVYDIIQNWYLKTLDENINEESKDIVKEFYKADKFLEQKQTIVLTLKFHPHAYHTSRLLNFTKQLNEKLKQKENENAEFSGMFHLLNKILYLKVLKYQFV